MFARSLLSALVLAISLTGAIPGCVASRAPELRVIGIHEEPRREIVFVQVTNPARQPMRLTRLEYRFAAGRTTVSEGALALARDVPAGEAVVVEVPLRVPASEAPLTLRGRLTAVTDQIVQIFDVSAQVDASVK